MASSYSIKKVPGFGAIAVACVAILYLPIATLVAFAFNSGTSIAMWEGFSFRWFISAWRNQDVMEAAWRSIKIAAFAAALATLVATPAALATTRVKSYRGLLFKTAVINVPLVVPEIVTAVGLLILFARIKVWTGYTGSAYLMLSHAAFCVPFAYMPLRARLDGMDLSLERAASDLYASKFNIFRYITLPLLAPAVLAGLMLSFVISLDDVVITEFIKSGGQETLPTYMLGQIRRGITPEMNAISAVFLLISLAIVTAFFFLNRKTDA